MELRDYLNVMRTRKWVILQAVVIVTLTAVVVALIEPPTYRGEAKVLISQTDTGAVVFGTTAGESSNQPERALLTQVQLMQLRSLAESTIRKLGLGTSPEELLERVSVVAVGDTNVVLVQATASTPEGAADIANTMATEYVEWSRETRRESIRTAADEVASRLSDAEAQILELGRRIQAEGKSDDLAAELQIATGTYTTLAEKYEQLRINEQLEIGSGRVVSVAVSDVVPIAPRPVRSALIAAAVGLMLGLAMAFLYEYLDDTIKSADDIEKLYGAPVLGTIPLEKYEKGVKRRLTIVESPGSPAAEAYRVLRNSLDFVNFEHELKAILVTSAAPAEGKSTVTANLAVSLSQTGKRVVLVSCDFRRPTTEQFFGVNNMIGLSDVLLGTHSLKAALQRPGDDSLIVLTSGMMPPNPSELLGSDKMRALIEELEEWADLVLIDTPPLLAVADPAAVARWCDGVLIVTQAGRSTRGAALKAVEVLSNVGARVIGVAVWGLDESKQQGMYGYYAGGYYYYANYYATGDQRRSKREGVSTKSAEVTEWIPDLSPGRRLAAMAGRILGAVLGVLLVLAIVLVVTYFLDSYFGWGLLRQITSTLL